MKLIISGSRVLQVSNEELTVILAENGLYSRMTEIVSGGARGIDTSAIELAKTLGMQYTIHIPGWKQHGQRYAAFVRNIKMAFYADELLAIWDGKSKGTAHMIEQMMELGKPSVIITR